MLDPEMQLALKQRLESLGDVVVAPATGPQTCSASWKPIAPGTLTAPGGGGNDR